MNISYFIMCKNVYKNGLKMNKQVNHINEGLHINKDVGHEPNLPVHLEPR